MSLRAKLDLHPTLGFTVCRYTDGVRVNMSLYLYRATAFHVILEFICFVVHAEGEGGGSVLVWDGVCFGDIFLYFLSVCVDFFLEGVLLVRTLLFFHMHKNIKKTKLFCWIE